MVAVVNVWTIGNLKSWDQEIHWRLVLDFALARKLTKQLASPANALQPRPVGHQVTLNQKYLFFLIIPYSKTTCHWWASSVFFFSI